MHHTNQCMVVANLHYLTAWISESGKIEKMEKKKMRKRVLISGGLGNQMFEYAFFLSLKERGIDCILDITPYSVTKMHNGYELERVFGIDSSKASTNFLNIQLTRFIRKIQWNSLVFKTRFQKFDEKAYFTNAIYYMGEWINERFFLNVEQQVRDAFKFQNIDERNMCIVEELFQCNSVSLHIRRGDYLRLPNYMVCDEEYYRKAVNYILSYVKKPKFYLFSNDLAWSENFIKKIGVDYEVIKHNQGFDGYKDMFLMSKCRHNIISNSTFSWWGAWLNNNPDKRMVGPSTWFRDRIFVPDADMSNFNYITVL